MIKDIAEHNATVKSNTKELQILKQYFPSCFSGEEKFDIEAFRNRIKENVTIQEEGYELNFLGKSYAKLLASLDTDTIIVPDSEHNSLPENQESKNIYISGDNLDALKHLLNSYCGQVKCIYIDPPYNTGKDEFAYNDKFEFTEKNLEEKLSVGWSEARRILDLTKKSKASHSAWLTFMYPRLTLARDLLSSNGIIFISIDDNEQANLKLLCDYIFGEENCLGTIIWKNATDNNPTNIACEHEYILCYAQNKTSLESVWKSPLSDVKEVLIAKGKELTSLYKGDELQKEWKKWYKENKWQLSPLDRYKYIDEEGVYTGSQSVHNPGKEGYRYDIIHPTTGKPCKQPLMGYRFPEETMKGMIEEGRILFGQDESKLIEIKLYAKEYVDKLSSVYTSDSRSAANDLKKLFPEHKQLFKNPKPVELIEHLLSFMQGDDFYIMDFFSGSGTTAQAILNQNVRSQHHYKYIMVQWPEACKETSEAGYKTIDEIGQERIRRAAAKLKEQYPDTDADLGFKHYTLQDISATALDRITGFIPEENLIFQNIHEEFGVETILRTWMVKDGYGFIAHPHELILDKYRAWYCGKHLYLIEPGLTEGAVCRLFEKYTEEGGFVPDKIIMFGYSFNLTELNMIKLNLSTLRDGNLTPNLDIRY